MLKWTRKSYRHDLAPRAWRYVIDAATKQYASEHAPGERWWRVLSPATRDVVAMWMTEEFERLADAGQFDVLVARRKPSPAASPARSGVAEPLAALFAPPRLPPAPPASPAAKPARAYKWQLTTTAPAAPAAEAPSGKVPPVPPVVHAVFEGPVAAPDQPTPALAEMISVEPLALAARRRVL